MRLCFIFCALLCSARLFGREEAETDRPLSVAEFREQVTRHLTAERFRSAEWGIKIASLESGVVVYETNAHKLLKPASNAKLYTGALALDALGPDYRIRTSLYAKAPPESGVLKGDLIVYGRGDPSFSVRFETLAYTNLLSPLIEAIRDTGITRIEGDIVGDSTFFSGAPFGGSWGWDDLQYYYGAAATALSVQDNTVDLAIAPAVREGAACTIQLKPETDFLEIVNRAVTGAPDTRASIEVTRPLAEKRVYITGCLPKGHAVWNDAVSVPNPPLWFVTLLKSELAQAGVEVTGHPRAVSPPEFVATDVHGLQEVASVSSPPISTIVQRMMKPSQNLYAQLLLLQVGARAREREPRGTSEERGIERLREFTHAAGIEQGEVLMDDGSGLSRSALVTPAATVQLLTYMAHHKCADIFRAALPEAGMDGTLRNRLKDLKGQLQAKTGTIRYVNTLSGYMTTHAGEPLVFSFMLNAYDAPHGSNSRDEIDLIPRLAVRLVRGVSADKPASSE